LKSESLPFWIAGGAGSPGTLRRAQTAGATGVQVGTLFAYSDESGFPADIKRSILAHAVRGELQVRTDPRASPTGYPFKVVDWPAHPAREAERERVCDIGHLRTAYRRADGKLGYRCAAEPVDAYVKKGGRQEDAIGRQCLCNALFAAIGDPQVRAQGGIEPMMITSGDDLQDIATFLNGRTRYSASEVIDYLLTGATSASSPTDAAGAVGQPVPAGAEGG